VGQLVHAAVPGAGAYVPATQVAQVADWGAPVAAENRPGPQLEQLAAPLAAWYWPAGQAAQAAAPAGENLPAAHGWQAATAEPAAP
jgi:hypothetical protein